MVTHSDYEARAIRACRSVLIELISVAGEIRNEMAIVGGWVPSLIISESREDHIGSMDVDVALDFANISGATYNTLLELLARRGYRIDEDQPFRFFRDVSLDDSPPVTVEIDFLAGEYGGTGKGHRTQRVQNIRARKTRGCDFVFNDTVEILLKGELPGGGINEVSAKVAGPVSFLVMKGMALANRLDEKDAYDVYYLVSNFPGGLDELVKLFQPWLKNSLAREGLQKIREKFASIEHVGSKMVADFLEVPDKEEREIVRRQAYETVNELLLKLGF